MTGTVKIWFEDKKYGFLTADEQDYFVHISSVENKVDLVQGQTVSFEPAEGRKGKNDTAINVKVLSEQTP